jgi:hypothetical protein
MASLKGILEEVALVPPKSAGGAKRAETPRAAPSADEIAADILRRAEAARERATLPHLDGLIRVTFMLPMGTHVVEDVDPVLDPAGARRFRCIRDAIEKGLADLERELIAEMTAPAPWTR